MGQRDGGWSLSRCVRGRNFRKIKIKVQVLFASLLDKAHSTVVEALSGPRIKIQIQGMKYSETNLSAYSTFKNESQYLSMPVLSSKHGVNSEFSVSLPKPQLQYTQNKSQSTILLVQPPSIPQELPNLFQCMSGCLKSTASLTEPEQKLYQKPRYPILEMMLKQQINTDTLDCIRALNLSSGPSESDSFDTRIFLQEQIMRCELPKFTHVLTRKLIYSISYRFSHKFTFRFKTIELEFDTLVSVNGFKKRLFQKLFKKAKSSKEVYIEKQRDLVPLVDMSQLFTSKMNFIQVRNEFKKFGVVEKPILMKKKIKPTIGITQLSNANANKHSNVVDVSSN